MGSEGGAPHHEANTTGMTAVAGSHMTTSEPASAESSGSFFLAPLKRDVLVLAKRVHLSNLVQESESPSMLAGLGGFAFWVILVLVAAALYQKYKASLPVDLKKAQAKSSEEGFLHGPFSCLDDPEVSVWSLCCGGVRWADNMQAVGTFSFWVAIAIYLGVAFADVLTGGVFIWGLVAALFTYYRQDLRSKFGLKSDRETILKDFALWCCCAPCAIAQETRHIVAAPKGAKPANA
eukprot:CAMPEP_0170624078 /NCGR_PEP_ID=MMETSP0224-20130122/30039_1 /TAXON_ID=285029 /ORGANISM="Togula jolla, Strain CCCM 725" /LENGTH=234 /DNA_ID=CAMNT_0010950573 /DNA_START=329 /DNA_END=1033 /DNA_ORIENTATION=-